MEFKRSSRPTTALRPGSPGHQTPGPFNPRPVQPHPTVPKTTPVQEPLHDSAAEEAAAPDPVRKRIIIVGAIIIVLIIASAVAFINLHNNEKTAESSHPSSQNLGFTPVLPGSKTIDQLGGWKRVSPADKDPVYAYSDTIESIPVTVSEQAIPASFKASIEASVAELARGYSAKAEIGTGANTVYIGTSAKGPQSVIFTKNGLLVLIKSQKVIQIASWAKYIGSLN